LTLYYSLPEHIEIPIGAYCEFEGETYTLERPENFKKHNTRNFEYTLIMDSAQSKLGKYKFKDTVTRRLKFSLTAKPEMHLQMLVDNMNRRESGWLVGKFIDSIEKVISYNHAFCSDALSQISEAFETEWEIVGKTINLCKVEYNKDNPLPLSYGRGNGFKSGVGRSNTDNSNPVEILFVQGGERNIDASKYPNDSEIKSRELLLPREQAIGYDGQYFSNQEEYNSSQARMYVSDGDGFSIQRSDKELISQNEDSLDCSHIYPSRVGTISAVNVVDAENHFYDITDSSIPDNLNFEDCLIEGEKMTVIFQDGMLAGKEFEVKYIHADKRFEILPQEIDGQTMPNDVFAPVIEGKYAVFGMMMPDAYICDDATKTGASWDMFREAVKYLYENEEQKFTFTGEMDGIWAKKDWLNIGGKIKTGGYVMFTDDQFHPTGVLIRIVGIKDYIGNENGINAGMSGIGNDDDNIRIWAGDTKENKAIAPFRVQNNGKMIADNGEFSGKILIADGKILLNKDGSGQLASGNITWDIAGNITVIGKFESSVNGDRIVIDPENKKIQMINSNNKVVFDLSFYNDSSNGSSPNMVLYNYNGNGDSIGHTQFFGGRIIVNKGFDFFDISIDENNQLLWLIDPERLPTSGTYYGQIYRNGNYLCVKPN
jgi:hypothetical protein